MYYDVVVSVYEKVGNNFIKNDNDYYLQGGFKTKAEAIEYIDKSNINEYIYTYSDNEYPCIEIVEYDDYGSLLNIISMSEGGLKMNNAERLKVGDLVIHFKHELDSLENQVKYLYLIKEIAQHSETGEKLVIYQNIISGIVYARPYDMFMSVVDNKKYPTVKSLYRFTKWV